jgi:hypothetical protein
MSIEISNAIHAMAIVSVDNAGHAIFVGQGNVGFAPFGTGPNFSEQLGTGRFRLHMLAPISILTPNQEAGRGEGMVIVEPLGLPAQSFPLVPPVNMAFVSPGGLSDLLINATSSATASQPSVSGFAEVSEDTTINAGPFSDLLTVPVHLPQGGSGTLDILATVSAQASGEVQFQLTLDGMALGPGAANGASFSAMPIDDSGTKESVSIMKRVIGVTPGDHAVKLQWKVLGAEASASIIVTTGFEHGSLRVTEQASSEAGVEDNITFQVLVLRFPQQSSTTT